MRSTANRQEDRGREPRRLLGVHGGREGEDPLINEMDSDHPMHHPFHIHGAGRFLIRSRDEKPETNLVWKDTLLLCGGETVDILLYVTNPGLWMAYCHITEHIESARCQELDTLIHYSGFGRLNLRV